jgi:restriction system protein
MSLDSWLELMYSKKRELLYPNNCFPTDEFLHEYLKKMNEIDEEDFYKLLRMLLVNSATYGIDHLNAESYLQRGYQKYPNEYFRRLFETGIAYEGITWIIDLLRHSPTSALTVIEAFLKVHFITLPDNAINGLYDAQVLIRARYLQNDYSPDTLLKLNSREFECLIAKLYREIGYDVILTEAKSDGGKDVIAINNIPGKKEKLYIECKLYNKRVGIQYARALLGTISNDRITKGVLISPLGFTKGCIKLAKENARIELLGAKDLIELLDEHLGKNWFTFIPKYVREFEK